MYITCLHVKLFKNLTLISMIFLCITDNISYRYYMPVPYKYSMITCCYVFNNYIHTDNKINILWGEHGRQIVIHFQILLLSIKSNKMTKFPHDAFDEDEVIIISIKFRYFICIHSLTWGSLDHWVIWIAFNKAFTIYILINRHQKA